MSPTTRIRVHVAFAAVAAAAVVAGVVYATRQDPPQPVARCGRIEPLIVPGVPSDHRAEVRAAFALGPKAAARALEPLAQTSPSDPVVQFNAATALLCAGYPFEASQAYRLAKRAGRDTYYEVRADNLLHPQFFANGYPPFEYFGK